MTVLECAEEHNIHSVPSLLRLSSLGLQVETLCLELCYSAQPAELPR